jgi:pyruvate/2-oxoglutarate/acetoin dehydrogenase E1 component
MPSLTPGATLEVSADRNLTIVQALREAVREEMSKNDDVFVIGEDIQIGGSFLFTLGLLDEFGPERVINTPISEAGFIGLSIGAAIQGMRPIVDFQYGDFLFTANELTGFFFHIPGIKIVTPATPYDAKGLFKASVADDNIVLFCVHKHLYGSKGRKLVESEVSKNHVPEEEYTIPLGVGDIKRAGEDITVVANSLMLHHALNVAKDLAEEGVSIEVIDPRTLVPLDIDLIVESVKKTHRLVVIEENNERGGWGAQVVADVAARAIGYIDAPIRRVATPDVPIPFAPVLESCVIPGEEQIRQAILELL